MNSTFRCKFDLRGATFLASFDKNKRESAGQYMHCHEFKVIAANSSFLFTELGRCDKRMAVKTGFPHSIDSFGDEHDAAKYTPTSVKKVI